MVLPTIEEPSAFSRIGPEALLVSLSKAVTQEALPFLEQRKTPAALLAKLLEGSEPDSLQRTASPPAELERSPRMSLFSHFKSLLGKSKSNTQSRCLPAVPMEHPVLGSLASHKTFPESLSGVVKFGSDQVELLISPDNRTIEVALELAVALIDQLPQLDAKSRSLVAKEFLDSYNTNWRFGEAMQQDGTSKPLEKPLLSEEQFCQNLQLTTIEASGEAMLVFWYGDNDMFGGHTLELTSFDGTAFEDTHASMAG